MKRKNNFKKKQKGTLMKEKNPIKNKQNVLHYFFTID